MTADPMHAPTHDQWDTPRARALRAAREEHGVDSPEARSAFEARIAEVMATEARGPTALWMLSFADPTRPKGSQYLGGAVVAATGPVGAVTAAHLYGCNPGGEVATVGPLPIDAIGPEWHNRLLTRAEVEAIPAPPEGVGG